jgi:hypothetical protein
MSSRARGIRGRDQQWLPVEEAWQELADQYPRLSLNDFLWILLDLGRWAWSRLPDGMRQQMLAPHKVFTKRQKQQMRIQSRLDRIASEELRIDDKLSLGLPALVKATIRRDSTMRKMRMSPYVRERLGIKA